jgi:hypothetical protein
VLGSRGERGQVGERERVGLDVVAKAAKDIDAVLDPVSLGAAARARSVAVLRPVGTLVSVHPVSVDPPSSSQSTPCARLSIGK